MLIAAARATIAREAASRAATLCNSGDDAFALDDEGGLRWDGVAVARLRRGETILAPRIVPAHNEFLDPATTASVLARLENWFDGHRRRVLGPLFAALDGTFGAAARGLAFQLAEGLGATSRNAAKAQIAALDPADRKHLGRLGLRFGVHALYFAPLLRPPAQRLREVLAEIHSGSPAPRPGRASTLPRGATPVAVWTALGFRVLGAQAIRVDCAERLAAAARKRARRGPFRESADLVALAGCEDAAFAAVMRDLGFRATTDGGFRQPKRGGRKPRRRTPANAHSPFAKLRDLALAK